MPSVLAGHIKNGGLLHQEEEYSKGGKYTFSCTQEGSGQKEKQPRSHKVSESTVSSDT